MGETFLRVSECGRGRECPVLGRVRAQQVPREQQIRALLWHPVGTGLC